MKKILIIEDNPIQQQVYELKLKAKYQLSFIGTGTEVQDAIKSSFPDLIILDIMLPGGQNGFDVLRILKENPDTSKIPVIMLTNLGEEQKKIALECGASEYFTKTGIGPTQLDQVIGKYI